MTSQLIAFKVCSMPRTLTTFLKKSNRALPISVYGKYVNDVSRGHEMMETTAIPMTMALFTLYDIKYAVSTPPQRRPIHKEGLVILCDLHTPVTASRYCSGQPAISTTVAVAPPVMAPIPDEYESPIIDRNRPIPQPLAILMLFGSRRTSHCRIPSKARNIKIHPSMKTAASASPYEMDPVPWKPTT